jgi:hypothetical protein
MTYDGFDAGALIEAPAFIANVADAMPADGAPTLDAALAQGGRDAGEAAILDRGADTVADLWLARGGHAALAPGLLDSSSPIVTGGSLHHTSSDGSAVHELSPADTGAVTNWSTGPGLDGSDGLDPALRLGDYLPQGNYFDLSSCAMTPDGQIIDLYLFYMNMNITVNGHVPDGANLGSGITLVNFNDGVQSLYKDGHWLANVVLIGAVVTNGASSFETHVTSTGITFNYTDGNHVTYTFQRQPGH